MKSAAVVVALTCLVAGLSLEAADKPRLPVTRNDAAPAEGKVRLGGVLDFTPPDGWVLAKQASTPMRSAYVSPDKQAMISVELLPATMVIEAKLAPEMMTKMRQNRKANSQKFVQEPTAEKDDRFVIRIRERYEIKDKIADQLHLYRAVGPRFLLVTINSLAGEEKAKEHHEIAVTTSLSGEFVKGK